MKNLKETIPFMTSADYKERFIAEYWQLKIRYEKLRTFNANIEIARLYSSERQEYIEPEHDCPYALLKEQQKVMGELLHILEMRAIIENISLDVTNEERA